MKQKLAEQLLAYYLEWNDEVAQDEIKYLQFMARLKYDHYHNFEPGMRFIASLAMWLSQFKTIEERQSAYNFVKTKLIFISNDEINQLVDIAYPERIFPVILKQVAQELNKPTYCIKKIENSQLFKVQKRKSLFLGMSDGCRIDILRRRIFLDNEQVSASYELSEHKCADLKKDLQEWLTKENDTSEPYFVNIFLVDDFSGSGTSIIREKEGKLKGKLNTLMELLSQEKNLGSITSKETNLYLLLYVATKQALKHISSLLPRLAEKHNGDIQVLEPLQSLKTNYRDLPKELPKDFSDVIKKYYDPRARDKHTDVGGTKDVRYGYAGCGLSLIFEHNTPNNSLALLWADWDEKDEKNPGMKALFPRISRHKEERP
jgi:hypothetical protein